MIDPKELAEEMAENLRANDANRDEVDEAEFQRSLEAEPYQGGGTDKGGQAEPFRKPLKGRGKSFLARRRKFFPRGDT